jgi:endonuclease G
MAQKRSTSTKRKTSGRKRPHKKKTRSSFGTIMRITLGLLILIILGYTGLAIWEGKFIIDEVSEFEIPDFFDDEELVDPNISPSTPDKAQKQVPNKDSSNPNLDQFDGFDANQFDLYFTKAFDFGWPAYDVGQAIIERPYFTLRYDESHEQADWVAHTLRSDSLRQRKYGLTEDYRKDPRIKTGSATPGDYRRSDYKMAQMAPAEDFSYNEFAISQSFYMSNISPQTDQLNSGAWKQLEALFRTWAMAEEEIYVVTGPVLSSGLSKLGKSSISVPKSFYKIALDMRKPRLKAIAFLVPNENISGPLNQYEVSIDELERLTGLDFFPSIPDELEAYLESGVTADQWSY